MSDWSDKLSFREFTDFLERLVKSPKKTRFKNIEKFLVYCRKRVSDNLKEGGRKLDKEKDSLFPVMRFFLPGLDKERGAYNMKETVIASLYIEFLQLGKNSDDAMKLKNFKAPKVVQDDAGDFASVLFTVLAERSYESTGMSCKQLNHKLDEIVRLNQTGGRREVANVFKHLFLNMSAVEQKWLLRIILKEMRLSIGHNSILSALHRDAREMYEVNSNLRKVCEALHDPSARLHQIDIQLFHSFKPQLADRMPLANIEKAMKGKTWYVDTKYDGERMQAHMQDTNFKFFSRNGNDFTSEFGSSAAQTDKFASFLAASIDLNQVKSVILDGEICAWDKHNDELVQKSDKNDIRNIKDDNSRYQQCLVIYDICYLNDKVLTDLPLKERIEMYKSIITPVVGRVQFSQRSTATTGAEVLDALHTAIDNREEGLVLKDPDSVYKPNARTGSGWIKVKPDYENGLMDQLDLVVLGGYFGTGRRAGGPAQFLLGLRDASKQPTVFLSCCRVSNGYTESELIDLIKRCGPQLKVQPDNVLVTKDKPDVWFKPEDAPVLQVNAAETMRSTSYAAEITLRFPRVELIRTDKDSSSCTSLQEMETIRIKGGGKLYGNKKINDINSASPPKRPRTEASAASKSIKPKLRPCFTHKDMSNERIETFCLKDKIVVVEPCPDIDLKRNLERIVVKHGGTVEQNSRAGRTSIYIQTLGTIKAKNVIKQGLINVVKADWLLACDREFKPFGPQDTVFAVEETRKAWKDGFDEYGDSYSQPATLQSLKSCLDAVGTAPKSHRNRLSSEKDELLSDIMNYKHYLFKGKRFFLEYPEFHQDKLKTDIVYIKNYGGEIVDDYQEGGFSHLVLLEPSQLVKQKFRSIREYLITEEKSIFVEVTPDWIYKCIEQEKLVSVLNQS